MSTDEKEIDPGGDNVLLFGGEQQRPTAYAARCRFIAVR
jgi:hypothetical protein